MNARILIFIGMLLGAQTTYAQEGFFQTLSKHGEDANYKEYYSLYDPEKDGTYEISSKRYEMTIRPKRIEGGLDKIGFESETSETKASPYAADVIVWDDSLIGFPHTYMIYNQESEGAYVFIEDYIFKLEEINLENFSYKTIDVVLIREGSGQSEEEPKTEEGKGKLKGKLGALKNKVASSLVDPDVAKLQEKNLDEYISTYLNQMKAKNDAYQMTASEQAELDRINLAALEYDIEVNELNNAYWASPAGQETLRRMRENSGESACEYVVIDNRFDTNEYVMQDGNSWTFSQGENRFPCGRAIYFKNSDGSKGSLIGGGDSSYAGQVIVLD
ncbi:MAG: hypothetical protein ACFHU9_16970 [Fluviicola sp.]